MYWLVREQIYFELDVSANNVQTYFQKQVKIWNQIFG